ncbi:hypothetical protein Ccr2_gp025 [Caulobacter phage Ccr2]|nr:hypothetical protein Ccr10_gp026 [Caulobacter phage Ccr10]ARB13900.1 hypothetical protein Ccr2_gp025 [Caulobacter phage Ccr2]ARB14589.1 hypothetical protein Ccr29_gp032 [Caulobacter phage Ccr29]
MTAALTLARRFTPTDLAGAMKMVAPYGILADPRAASLAASMGMASGDARHEDTILGLKVLLFKNVPVWTEAALTLAPEPPLGEVLRFLILGRAAHTKFIARRAEAWGWREQYDPMFATPENYCALRDQFQADFPERHFGGTHGLNKQGLADLLARDDVLDVQFHVPAAPADAIEDFNP